MAGPVVARATDRRRGEGHAGRPGRRAVVGERPTRYNSRAVNENGETPADTLLCGRCDTLYDPEDNFCRHCGLPLHEQHLPSVRDSRDLPAVWQPSLPATVIKGAALVAAGTLAPRLALGLLRRALRRGPKASHSPARRAKGEVLPQQDAMPEDAQVVSETFLLRRVRIRH